MHVSYSLEVLGSQIGSSKGEEGSMLLELIGHWGRGHFAIFEGKGFKMFMAPIVGYGYSLKIPIKQAIKYGKIW